MPSFDPDSPYNRESKHPHAGKVYWIHPDTLDDIGAMPSNKDEPCPTKPSEITRNGQARLMVCLADFPDGTGAPGASLWLPLQSKGDVKLSGLDKCGYDPGQGNGWKTALGTGWKA